MDSSAVITQISKEEARGPLRGKGTGGPRRGLQPGRRGRGEGGARTLPRAAAAAAPVACLGGARSSQPERERGEFELGEPQERGAGSGASRVLPSAQSGEAEARVDMGLLQGLPGCQCAMLESCLLHPPHPPP